MSSIEQQIMDAVITNLKKISISEGYSFDLCGRVYEWRDIPLEETRLPAVDVRDTVNEMDDEDEDQHILRIEVTLYEAGSTAPAKVRLSQADVIKAFGKIVAEACVTGAAFLSAEKEVEKGARTFAAVKMQFEVYYHAFSWEI